MPINENAVNAALAGALSGHRIHATPEQTRTRTGLKRCDVQIRRKHGDRYYTALECKIGQNETQQNAAVKDAQRWLKQSDCWNAVALCYPKEIAEPKESTLEQILENAEDLLMVRVNQGGPMSRWHEGGLDELAKLADDIGANETYAITDTLKHAITVGSNQIATDTCRELATALELPWELNKECIDPRPARIACLIIANMALLHNRLQSELINIPDLKNLIEVLDSPNRQRILLQNWQRIRDVDYAPVVDPALAVLQKLPTDHHTESILEILIEAVLECVPRIRGLQLDHAGPLYHGLLQTARYDGSFYTSTSAAVLLADLALPRGWFTDERDWTDVNKLAKLKICDPACGTGTLLMAAARSIQERYLSAGGIENDLEVLHLSLIEDVLYGLDINRHAIHLAACMLTLNAPKIDYNKMNLYNMQHGVNAEGEVRAGSLDLLVDDASYIPGLAPDTTQFRTTAEGYRDEAPDLTGLCDLVIMNPPFTRNNIRNLSLPAEERKLVQKHEVSLAKTTSDAQHRSTIDQSTIGTFFTPIADRLLNSTGSLAIVKPYTMCTNASGKHERNLLTDPNRFHLELVVTSHDNRRIYFSENTDIHECLIVTRRPSCETEGKPTAFISLAENPSSASEAHYLAKAIRQAINGDTSILADYGTITWRSLEKLRDKPWNAACFYDQALAEAYDMMLQNSALKSIGGIASIQPAGRRVYDAFIKARHRQNPDMCALWSNRSDRQIVIRTTPDEFLVPKPGMHDYAGKLWEMRSSLLLVNRMRLNLARTPAVFSDKPILGAGFVPVTPQGGNREILCKAWCIWFNSTPGTIAFLNIRQKNLTYPHFSLDGLRSLPVPSPDRCDIDRLVAAYNQYANETLLALPLMNEDPVRRALDDAVLEAVPGLSNTAVAQWQGFNPA